MDNNKEICKTLSEVCIMLAEYTKDKKMSKKFNKKAEIFKGLGEL